MENKMDNIFDYVADFYAQDEEWNTVLQQSYVENFLRTKLWQGASEEELLKDWEHITVLCIFLGNSDNYLGDMTRESFIDCVPLPSHHASEHVSHDRHPARPLPRKRNCASGQCVPH